MLGVSQPGLQRIICFDIGKQNTTFHLVIELFDQGNLVLCNDAWTIIQPLRPHRFRERDIIAGEVLKRNKICRTFSDCTTGPRNGMLSGCFPLDPYYKEMPEAQMIKGIK